jgi:hypothetical protein
MGFAQPDQEEAEPPFRRSQAPPGNEKTRKLSFSSSPSPLVGEGLGGEGYSRNPL